MLLCNQEDYLNLELQVLICILYDSQNLGEHLRAAIPRAPPRDKRPQNDSAFGLLLNVLGTFQGPCSVPADIQLEP
jgi:hypothetical protein